MAGPGGGPPRKSHTKSRKGCKTCKRRHIRCDETFPQCSNCTKHSCRCDYRDSVLSAEEASRSPEGPDLMWTPELEETISYWQRTARFPFPDLPLHSAGALGELSKSDLRLVYHLVSIHQDMQRKDFISCTFWARDIPSFLNTAIEHDFVMSSILALSATHLAWVTKSAETDNLAYYHRGLALNGLGQSISNFCRDSSDAVLAASILLSWQASDWGSWTSLMHGISTVVQSMLAWKDRSRFVEYIETHGALMSRNRMLPSALAFGGSGLHDDDSFLPQAATALQQMLARHSHEHLLSQRFEDLLRFTQDMQTGSATMQVDQLFEQLKPLRAWLFWLPVATAQAGEISIPDMVFLAHLYGVALAVDASIPELGGAPLGIFAAQHIEELDCRIRFTQGSRRPGEDYTLLNNSMQFPRAMASSSSFPKTIGSDLPEPGQQSPYGIQHLTIGSQPGTPGFPGQFQLGPTHSFEDIDITASQFQHAFSAPTSRRQSQLLEASSWGGGTVFDTRSPSTFSFRENSPAYSHGSIEDEQTYAVGSFASGYSGGETGRKKRPAKGKMRRIS